MRHNAIRAIAVLAIMLAAAAPAMAQEPQKGEFAGSFTWADSGMLEDVVYQPTGFLVEGTYFVNEWFGITSEFGYATGSGDALFAGFIGFIPVIVPGEISVSTLTATGGARFRFVNDSIVTPSARVVAGLGHLRETDTIAGVSESFTESVFAVTFGGAVDFQVNNNAAIRVQPDVILLDASETMFRLAFGVTYSFGGSVARTPRPPQAAARRTPAPAPAAAAPARQPVAAQPTPVQQQLAQTPTGSRIAAGAIPVGTVPPQRLGESAGWTRLTGTGVAYEWRVTVGNNDVVAHTASATATLYDINEQAIATASSELVVVEPGARLALGGTSEVSRQIAEFGSYWTITVRWVDR